MVAIKAEEMNKGAVTSPQELIMGKVPGLSVSQGDGALVPVRQFVSVAVHH